MSEIYFVRVATGVVVGIVFLLLYEARRRP